MWPLFSKVKDALFNLIKSLPDFLFPKSPRIIHLESLSSEELLNILPPSRLEDPSNPSGQGNVIALFDYSDSVVKELVWEVKYGGNRVLVDRLGEILYDVIESELAERHVFEKWKSVILMPMPVSDKRRYERGWNQAELLTEAIKKRDLAQHFKHLPRHLVKVVHTESQTRTADKRERRENLKDSMRVVSPLAIEGRYIVLVDDVTTTGFTFAEARRALHEAGVKKILCVSLAH